MIAELLPPEVIAGQRFDLNRPFGNGRDDNPANNIVDEPGEAEAAFWNPSNANLTTATMTAAGFTTFVPDYSNGGDANINGTPGEAADSQMARQLYARYLYVMMMLFRGSTDIDFDGMAANTPQETAHGIAQWAINVVDYRDSDAIMTSFEFDLNPFNGWDVDGNLFTTTGQLNVASYGVAMP